eukprot:m.3685 g.3685  ORF g.3685 m.3685 type:complete len:51 (+) comp2804_c0_seq1:1910-2062(+)
MWDLTSSQGQRYKWFGWVWMVKQGASVNNRSVSAVHPAAFNKLENKNVSV